jgi:hypothetical protein
MSAIEGACWALIIIICTCGLVYRLSKHSLDRTTTYVP